MIRIENLKRKIEEEGQLYIPRYVSEHVENHINDLGASYSEARINDAWKELKGEYRKISKEGTTVELYRTECHIIAYLQYYFFLNYPIIKWIMLKNLENVTEIIPRKDAVKIIDYGAGPGTASMAVCDFLEDAKEIGIYENTKIKLYFDEQYGFFSECYRKMLGGHETVESIKYIGEVGYIRNSYDIGIISYVLSELNEYLQEWLISNVCKCLKNGGYLVIIEPAYAYEDIKKSIGGFLSNKESRKSFKIVDASGPLCSKPSCELHRKCHDTSVKEKKLKTPEAMTEEMKRFFEERKEGRIRWVYAVLKKVEWQEGFVDPSELKEYQEGGGRIIKLRGWVIEKRSTGIAENITLCNGLGRCNLAFWMDRGEVFERVRDILEGDILCVEGELLVRPFHELPSISVTEIIGHKKRVD